MKKILIILGAIALLACSAPASADCDLCGDLNGDGFLDILDIVVLIDWYYSWISPPPACPAAADVNCDGAVRIICEYDPPRSYPCDDLQYLINYILSDGPPPCDPNDDGIPDCDPNE